MLRPHHGHTLTCPHCEQPGPHGTVDQCIEALKKAIAGETPRPRPIQKPLPAPTMKPAAVLPVDPLKPLSIRQACELLNVARSTIYTWMRTGKIDVEYTPGGAVRISRSQLLRARRHESRSVD